MPEDSATRRIARQLFTTHGFLIVALVLEATIFEVIARQMGLPSFLSRGSLILVLNRATVFGVLAVGMTFVILTAGIDLSVGSLAAFGGVICAKVVFGHNEHAVAWILAGWLVTLFVGLLLGVLSGTLVTKFQIPPFIATLALMSSIRGLGYIVAKGVPIAPLPDAYKWLGRFRIGGVVPVKIVVMLAVFAAAAVLLNYTRFGRHVRAIGSNEEAARLSGVNVRRVKLTVYCMASVLAVMGGMILSSYMGSGDPKAGLMYELFVIAAVVVGGTSLMGGQGSIVGTFIGLLIISLLESGLNWIQVQSFVQQVILGAVILAAVLLDRVKGRL